MRFHTLIILVRPIERFESHFEVFSLDCFYLGTICHFLITSLKWKGGRDQGGQKRIFRRKISQNWTFFNDI